jgi:hypothetical protein
MPAHSHKQEDNNSWGKIVHRNPHKDVVRQCNEQWCYYSCDIYISHHVSRHLAPHYRCSTTSYVLTHSMLELLHPRQQTPLVWYHMASPSLIITSLSLTFAFKYVQTNRTYLLYPAPCLLASFVCSICHYYRIIIRQTYNNCWKNYPINQLLA